MSADDPYSGPEITVTLVHGTWARRSPWTLPGSEMRKALEGRFGERMVLSRFSWWPWNSIRARVRGTQQLQAHLRDLRARYPGHLHFVVGHSHGGTITWYAMRDAELARGTAGVIALATPFLHAQPRPLRPPLEEMDGRTAAMGILAVCLIGLIGLVRFLWPNLDAERAVRERSGGAFLATSACVVAVAMMTRHFLLASLRRAQRRLLDKFGNPSLPDAQALIVRVAGDEASAILAAGALASWLVTRIDAAVLGCLSRLRGSRETRRKVMLAGILMIVGGILGWPAFPVLGTAIASVGCLMACYAHFAPVAAIVIDAVSSLLLFLIPVLSLPTSRDALFVPVTISITPEATPPGTYTLHQFDATVHQGGEDGDGSGAERYVPPGFLHSLAYDEPRVIELVLSWITARAASVSARDAVPGPLESEGGLRPST